MFFLITMHPFSNQLGSYTLYCPTCLQRTPHDLVQRGTKLTFFFLPIWKFGKKTATVCRRCGRVNPIAEGDVKHIQAEPTA